MCELNKFIDSGADGEYSNYLIETKIIYWQH